MRMAEELDHSEFDPLGIRTQSQVPAFKSIYTRQREEAAFLVKRFRNRENPCNDVQLLADDVGFGKTWVSMIALFSLLNKNNQHPHALVVTPSRLLADKWYRELLFFQKNYVMNSREFGVELVNDSGVLLDRLSTLASQRTQVRKLKSLFNTDESALLFMAFCLNEYLQSSEFFGNSESAAVRSVEKWIKNVLKREEAGLFHRFFSQSEIVRWVRFLRKYAAVVGYDRWLDQHASPEKIKRALKRRRLGNEAAFIESIMNKLGLGNNKKREISIKKDRIPAGRQFLRLAAETMPFLEVYNEDKYSRKPVHWLDEDYWKRTLRQLEKTANNGDLSLQGLRWLLKAILPKLENKVESDDSTKELIERVKRFTEHIEVKKRQLDRFWLIEPSEIVDFMGKFERFVKTNEMPGSLFDQSPWVHIGWDSCKSVKPSAFISMMVRELRLGKKIGDPTKEQIDTAKRFFSCAAALYGYLLDPPLIEKHYNFKSHASGQSYFWGRRKILHNIFVIYMNDLKKWGDTDPEGDWRLQALGRPIQLTIVDEVHNWTHEKKGAKEYKEYWSHCAEKTLLLSATPIQLRPENLQQIFDAVKDSSAWPEESAYESLFVNQNARSAEGLLLEALKKQQQVQDAWERLDPISAEFLEKKSEELENETGKKLKQKQLRFWKSLSKKEASSLQELSVAILDFHQFLEDAIRTPLSDLVMKNRSKKNRHYHCGQDVLNDGYEEPDIRTDHLYQASGLPNKASLFNFICMRLSTLGNHRDKNGRLVLKNPRLMLGLPSSYETLLESRIGKNLTASETTYRSIFKPLIEDKQLDLSHPKVEAVTDLVCENLLTKGEKTLVFCERLETVSVLKRRIDANLRAFYQKHIDRDALIKLYEATKSEVPKQPDKEAWLVEILERVSQQVFSEVFPEEQWSLSREQCSYDVRPYLTIGYVYSQLKGQGIAGLADAYAVLTQEEESELLNDGGVFDSIATLTGNSKKNRPSILKSFSSSGLPAVLVCTPVSQEGVDMHKYCRKIILHDLNWNPAKLEQRVGRVDRHGSLASVTGQPVEVFVPFLANSYDEYQYKRVLERSNLQELVFGRNEMVANEQDEDELTGEDNDSQVEGGGSTNLANIKNLIRGLFDMDLSLERLKE